MIKNRLTNEIAMANGVLQPKNLTSILNLYEKGQRRMTAEDVKNECKKNNITVEWNRRLAAICNAMRNAIRNGNGRIIGEDKPTNGFTISFDEKIR